MKRTSLPLRRREFITLIGGAAVAWPLAARAQQPGIPVIGFLNGQSPATSAHLVAAFRKGLSETGHVEGRNVAIEYRWAEGQTERLPGLAADLVRLSVAVISTGGSPMASLAAKAATSTVPIVFAFGGDPVESGLVASLSHPGGNVTGVSQLSNVLEEKRFGLLHELIPTALLIAVLLNANSPYAESQTRDVQAAAHQIGLRILLVGVGSEHEFETAFTTIVKQRADALIVASDPFFNNRRDQLVELAERYAVPTSYSQREYAVAGGLMSYGTSITDAYRSVGVYTGRILKGDKPADLPVVRPTKFELVINLKTAQTLGLTITPAMLAIADEVIE